MTRVVVKHFTLDSSGAYLSASTSGIFHNESEKAPTRHYGDFITGVEECQGVL